MKREPVKDYSSWQAFVSYGLACAAGLGDLGVLLAMRRPESYVKRKPAKRRKRREAK